MEYEQAYNKAYDNISMPVSVLAHKTWFCCYTSMQVVEHEKQNVRFLNCKAVPQHTYGGAGGRGGTAPTHSRPRHYMGESCQHHARPRFIPGVRIPGIHWTGGWVGPRAGLDTEARGQTRSLGRPVCSQTLYWLSYPSPLFIRYWTLTQVHRHVSLEIIYD
jgi:hypothetical protein